MTCLILCLNEIWPGFSLEFCAAMLCNAKNWVKLTWLIGLNLDYTTIKNIDVASCVGVPGLILCLLWNLWFFSLWWNQFLICWWVEMKNLLICMRRDLVMLVTFILSLKGLTTVVVVCYTHTPSFEKIHFSVLRFVHVFVFLSPITQNSC